MSKNPKNGWKLMKIANIDREFLHVFWTTWANSMNFSGKMCFKIILKVSKSHGSTLSIEDAFFKKPQGGGVNLIPHPYPTLHSPGRLGLNILKNLIMHLSMFNHFFFMFYWKDGRSEIYRAFISFLRARHISKLRKFR